MAETKEKKLDLWGALDQVPKENRADYTVEIERIAPETDEDGRFIAGFLGQMNLAQFNRDKLKAKYGGGIFKVVVRYATGGDKGKYFKQEQITIAGDPRPIDAASQHYSQTPTRTRTEPQEQPAGRGGYDQGYRDAMQDAARKAELADLKNTIHRLEDRITSGNGNGKGGGTVNEAISALSTAMAKLNPGGNGRNKDLDTLALIQLLRDERKSGQDLATQLFDMAQKYNADPDAATEAEMIGLVRDIVGNKGQPTKGSKLGTKPGGKTAAQVAIETFREIRDNLARIVGEFHALAGSSLAGSKTPDELFTNTRKIMEFLASEFAEDIEEPEVDNNATKTEPGEPGPDGDIGPGGPDQDQDNPA